MLLPQVQRDVAQEPRGAEHEHHPASRSHRQNLAQWRPLNERGGAARDPAPPRPSAAPPPRGAPPSRGLQSAAQGKAEPAADHASPEGGTPFVAPSKLGIPSPASTRTAVQMLAGTFPARRRAMVRAGVRSAYPGETSESSTDRWKGSDAAKAKSANGAPFTATSTARVASNPSGA